MQIHIIDIRLLPGHKATRAFCDIRLEDIIVRDFRVYQTDGSHRFATLSLLTKTMTGTYLSVNSWICRRTFRLR